jgi:excisionase family DNA binding protein
MNIEPQSLSIRDHRPEIRERDLFTEKEACEYLGVSPVTLWRERKNLRISFSRIGGQIRYQRSDIQEYLDRNRQSAVAVAA